MSPTLSFLAAFIFAYARASGTFHWSRGSLADQSGVAACPGMDVDLRWAFDHPDTDLVVETDWRYAKTKGAPETVVATMVNGRFFSDPRVGRVPGGTGGAGIRLHGVEDADAGVYSVRVVVNSNGNHVTYTQTAYVTVTDNPVISNGQALHAAIQGAQLSEQSGKLEATLACGPFLPSWMPHLNVLWTTPDNATVSSSGRHNDSFLLAVADPLDGGQFTCRVDPDSPAARCLHGSNATVQGASVQLNSNQVWRVTMEEIKSLKSALGSCQNTTASLAPQTSSTDASLLAACRGEGVSVVEDSNSWRSEEYGTACCDQELCDDNLKGWTRFTMRQKAYNISTSCVKRSHCNTDLPMWIDLEGQEMPAAVKSRVVKVCASKDVGDGAWCCMGSTTLEVLNCGTFLLYNLNGTPGCDEDYKMAYCVNPNN